MLRLKLKEKYAIKLCIQTGVKLYGTLNNRSKIYLETSKVLGEAGFIFDGGEFGTEIVIYVNILLFLLSLLLIVLLMPFP